MKGHEAAFDDLLVQRWHTCTLCGRVPGTYGGIWALDPSPLALCFVFCRRCEDDMCNSEAALDRLLRERYGSEEGDTEA